MPSNPGIAWNLNPSSLIMTVTLSQQIQYVRIIVKLLNSFFLII
jgi:hypothetical protein